jgi:hypothetical protein
MIKKTLSCPKWSLLHKLFEGNISGSHTYKTFKFEK